MVQRLPVPMKMNMNFIFGISEYLFEENVKKKNIFSELYRHLM